MADLCYEPFVTFLTSSSYWTLPPVAATSMNAVSPDLMYMVVQTLRLGEQVPSPCGEASDDTRKAALPMFWTPSRTRTGADAAIRAGPGVGPELLRGRPGGPDCA